MDAPWRLLVGLVICGCGARSGLEVAGLEGRDSDTGDPAPADDAPGVTTAAPGLVGHWPFDEGAGSVVHDVSGRGLHGALQGGSWVRGVLGSAVATNPPLVVDVADDAALQLTGSMTLEAWINIESIPSSHGMIIFRGDNRPGLDPYLLSTEPPDLLQFFVSDASGEHIEIHAKVDVGRFLHVVGTVDDASGAIVLYVDGKVASQSTTRIRSAGQLSAADRAGVGFGAHATRGPGNYGFRGIIDEIRIFEVALSADAISARYADVVGRSK